MDEPAAQSEASARDCSLPCQLYARALPEDPLEELIEMRYQQYLAQCQLQELLENGVVQIFES
jgi:hypothetical protein